MSESSILVVEDTVTVAQDIQEQLEEIGYTVLDNLRSGEEVVE
jgi:CheY-like chemotaxis protein